MTEAAASVRNLPPGRMGDIKKQFELIGNTENVADSGKELVLSPKHKQRSKNPFMSTHSGNVNGKLMSSCDSSNTADIVKDGKRTMEVHEASKVIQRKLQGIGCLADASPSPIAPVRKKRLSASDSERSNSESETVTYAVVNKDRNKVAEKTANVTSVSSRLKLFEAENDSRTDKATNKTRTTTPSTYASNMSRSEHDSMVSNISQLMEDASVKPVSVMTRSDDSYDRLNFLPTHHGSHVVIQRNNQVQIVQQVYDQLDNEADNVHHVLIKRAENTEKPQLPAKPTTPIPPKKPPRTHAHDQYLETKQMLQNIVVPPEYSVAKPIFDNQDESNASKELTATQKPIKPPKWKVKSQNQTDKTCDSTLTSEPKLTDGVYQNEGSVRIASVDVNPPVKAAEKADSQQSGAYKKITPAKNPGVAKDGVNRVSITRGVPVSARPDKPKRPPPPKPRPVSLVAGIASEDSPRRKTPPSRHSSFHSNPLYQQGTEQRDSRPIGKSVDARGTDENVESSVRPMNPLPILDRSAEFREAQRRFSNAISNEKSTDARVQSGKNTQTPNEKVSAISQMEQKKLPKLEAPVKTLHILPQQVQIMLWRSCSDEYIYTGDSTKNSPIYMDPMDSCLDRVTSLDDTFASADVEVYMDTEGYAIPYRFKKSRLSPRHSDSPMVISEKGKLKSRMRGLFRLVSESKEESGECETPKSRKRKLTLVKHKINTAFSTLRGYVRKQSASDLMVENLHESNVADGDSLVDQRDIQKRVEYVSSVRDKTHARIRSARLFEDKIYPQLFECALIVGLQRTKSGPLGWQPEILHKFPEMVNINDTIPQFCFPDSEFINPRTITKQSETYSFVLTNEEGGRVFGYCRRYIVYKLGWKTAEVICIISPLNSFNLYKMLLDEIEKRRMVSMDQAQELVASAFGRPLPSPGRTVQIRSMNEAGDMETIVLSRNMDTRLDNVDYDLLFSVLGVDKLIRTFSSMLLERRLLFTSTKLSLLSSTIHALASLLYPFAWQHTYIPVLPPNLLEITCSPTPYLIGILHSELDKVTQLPTEEILIIDLDTKSLLESMGDENTILPKKLYKALKSALNMCRVDAEAERSKNLMISEAFIRLFVELLGHYGNHMFAQQDGIATFEKTEFVSSTRSESVRQFLCWFVDTQMFEVFISDQTRLLKTTDIDLFKTRISEYKEEMEQMNPKSGKKLGKKFMNLGKAIRTKLA